MSIAKVDLQLWRSRFVERAFVRELKGLEMDVVVLIPVPIPLYAWDGGSIT